MTLTATESFAAKPVSRVPAAAPTAVLVVPCFNEAARLRAAAYLEQLEIEPGLTFLFVDDGSRDRTRLVLADVVQQSSGRTALLALDRNRGKAEAVRVGVKRALDGGAPVVGFWDADLATPLSELSGMAAILRERREVEMVFGSRVKLMGRTVERRWQRHYLGRVFATAVSAILDLPIYDSQCGAKLFRATPRIHSVFAEPFLARWVFDVEILARYLAAGGGHAGIYEQPLGEWRDVAGSKLRPLHYVEAARDLLRIRSRYRPACAKKLPA